MIFFCSEMNAASPRSSHSAVRITPLSARDAEAEATTKE